MFASFARSLLSRSLLVNAAPRICAANTILPKCSEIAAFKKPCQLTCYQVPSIRGFHAANSKVNYLDFRHRFRTNRLRLHLLIIRRKKMKKHQRKVWRKKFKCLIAKQRLKREIVKEKTFRVELLSMIRQAELFDPKEYALRKISEKYNKPHELTREERFEQLKELIRKNRYQVTYVKPKHRRAEI